MCCALTRVACCAHAANTTTTATGTVVAAATQPLGAAAHPGSASANAGKQQARKPPTQPPVKETAFTTVGSGSMDKTRASAADDTDEDAAGFGFGDDEPGYLSVGAGGEADEVVVGEAPGLAF